MRKFLVFSLPVGALILFVLIMLSGSYLKSSAVQNDNIPSIVQVLIDNVKNEKWEEANNNTDKLTETWDTIVNRVQFSSERDELNAFSRNIARLRAAIIATDKANALIELYEAYEHWKGLGE